MTRAVQQAFDECPERARGVNGSHCRPPLVGDGVGRKDGLNDVRTGQKCESERDEPILGAPEARGTEEHETSDGENQGCEVHGCPFGSTRGLMASRRATRSARVPAGMSL